MKKNFFLFFVTSKHSRQKSHVDEQSIMPINLFNLFDSFLTDPWSLILDSEILDPAFPGNPNLRPSDSALSLWLFLFHDWPLAGHNGLLFEIFSFIKLGNLCCNCIYDVGIFKPTVHDF